MDKTDKFIKWLRGPRKYFVSLNPKYCSSHDNIDVLFILKKFIKYNIKYIKKIGYGRVGFFGFYNNIIYHLIFFDDKDQNIYIIDREDLNDYIDYMNIPIYIKKTLKIME